MSYTPYRDEPSHSTTDLYNYYDNAGPSHSAAQDIPLPAQARYDSNLAAQQPMYTQAATHSVDDMHATSATYDPSRWIGASKSGSQRSKWIVIGSIIALVAIIGIGVGVGVAVSKNNSKSSTKTNTGSGSSPVHQSDPNDPSTFVKDSRLHKSFYGLAYTPQGSQLPECGNDLGTVIRDIQLISQLTTRIRLYGADCNQTALVLEAIKQTKVNLTVWLGNYAIATDNGAAYQRQRDVIKAAIQTYGTDHIGGITVGNEFMLNYLNANQATDANSDIGNTGAAILIANIKDTRDMLTGLNLNKNLPVGTADAGSYFNNQILQAVDYGMANVHPWFANVSAEDAASWTAQFFQTTDVDVANALPNKPTMYIAETGWPTKSSDAGNANNGPSTASESNLQKFLNTFVCQANTNSTGYFFFEVFDEPWKDAQFGGVEGWWGLFTSNGSLKNINIPGCQSP